jgi:hypothetical protein
VLATGGDRACIMNCCTLRVGTRPPRLSLAACHVTISTTLLALTMLSSFTAACSGSQRLNGHC